MMPCTCKRGATQNITGRWKQRNSARAYTIFVCPCSTWHAQATVDHEVQTGLNVGLFLQSCTRKRATCSAASEQFYGPPCSQRKARFLSSFPHITQRHTTDTRMLNSPKMCTRELLRQLQSSMNVLLP
eukprot:scaffold106259_cov21-Tisochrysis_lutea.AAC.2